MEKYKYVGLDVHKETIAVSVAETDGGEVCYLGEVPNTADSVVKLVKRLRKEGAKLSFCYEAGPCGYGLDRIDILLEHDLLQGLSELHFLEPAEMGLRPVVLSFKALAMPQQEAQQPLFGLELNMLHVLPRPRQISQRLLRAIRHPHRRQFPSPMEPGQVQAVPTIGLDAISGLPGNQRRCHHLAVLSEVQ